MKNSKWTLSALFAGVLLLGTSGVWAHGGEDHSQGDGHATDAAKGEKAISSHDGMTALYARLREIETRLAEGKLDAIHGLAEGMAADTEDLDKDTTLDATKKKRVQGYVKNVARLAGRLHDAADANKPDAAKKEFAKLKAQVDLLDGQFAHSHKPAAPPAAAGAKPVPGGERHEIAK